jgi:hypothetical protein
MGNIPKVIMPLHHVSSGEVFLSRAQKKVRERKRQEKAKIAKRKKNDEYKRRKNNECK